jgi:hypothetical protein
MKMKHAPAAKPAPATPFDTASQPYEQSKQVEAGDARSSSRSSRAPTSSMRTR